MRSLPRRRALTLLLSLSSFAMSLPGARADAPAKTRTFNFTYAATVSGLKPGQAARIWLPVAQSDEDQTVTVVSQSLPGQPSTGEEPKYHNAILYVDAAAGADGSVPLSVTYKVVRKEVGAEPAKDEAGAADAYLQPDALVPVGGKPAALIRGRTMPQDPVERAHALYDVVDDHMQYRKDKPGYGRGDAAWACDSGFGNCTDFHSLFISLARTEKLPSKFVIGFPLPEQHGKGEIPGYHCWAKFLADGQWVPVDISEANKHPELRDYYFGHLTPDRIGFTTGRDLTLVPKQEGPPLNYFVYPYVEVDGKPLPAEQIKKQFSFEDAEDTAAR